MPSLTAEQASEALSEIIQRMDEPETRELLEECRKHAAGDMEKIMQFIVPKVRRRGPTRAPNGSRANVASIAAAGVRDPGRGDDEIRLHAGG